MIFDIEADWTLNLLCNYDCTYCISRAPKEHPLVGRLSPEQYLDFFDATGAASRQVRPEQRKVLKAGPGVQMELLAWGNTVMEPHLFRVAPKAGSGESYTHEGEEFLYVLRGELAITLEKEEYRLKTGDSFYFESATPHHWKNPGQKETWVLWVNTPPTF